jgi:hypothetical protein
MFPLAAGGAEASMLSKASIESYVCSEETGPAPSNCMPPARMRAHAYAENLRASDLQPQRAHPAPLRAESLQANIL